MKITTFAALILCFFIANRTFADTSESTTYAEDRSRSTATMAVASASYFSIRIEDTETFFKNFVASAFSPGRAESETEGAFQQRLPKPWNADKVVYFVASKRSYDVYTRNPDAFGTKTLKITGGLRPASFLSDEDVDCACKEQVRGPLISISDRLGKLSNPVCLSESVSNNVVVDDFFLQGFISGLSPKFSLVTDCILNFDNSEDFIDCYDADQHSFYLSEHVEPDEVVTQGSDVNLVLGVRLIDYTHSALTCFHGFPSFGNPVDQTVKTYLITGSLVSVLLQDSATGAILAQRDIPDLSLWQDSNSLLTPAYLRGFLKRFDRLTPKMTKEQVFETLGLPPNGEGYMGYASGPLTRYSSAYTVGPYHFGIVWDRDQLKSCEMVSTNWDTYHQPSHKIK